MLRRPYVAVRTLPAAYGIKAFWAEREAQRKDEGGGLKDETGGQQMEVRSQRSDGPLGAGVSSVGPSAHEGAEETEETRTGNDKC